MVGDNASRNSTAPRSASTTSTLVRSQGGHREESYWCGTRVSTFLADKPLPGATAFLSARGDSISSRTHVGLDEASNNRPDRMNRGARRSKTRRCAQIRAIHFIGATSRLRQGVDSAAALTLSRGLRARHCRRRFSSTLLRYRVKNSISSR